MDEVEEVPARAAFASATALFTSPRQQAPEGFITSQLRRPHFGRRNLVHGR